MNVLTEGFKNRTWDELRVGDEASIEKTVGARDLYLFAHANF